MNAVKVGAVMLRPVSKMMNLTTSPTHPSPAAPPQVSKMGTTSFLMVSESSYVNPEYLGLIEIGLLGA